MTTLSLSQDTDELLKRLSTVADKIARSEQVSLVDGDVLHEAMQTISRLRKEREQAVKAMEEARGLYHHVRRRRSSVNV